MTPERPTITIAVAAARLGVTTEHVHTLIHRGELTGLRNGPDRRHTHVHADEIEAIR
jgi:excisionase family DNA binding protein